MFLNKKDNLITFIKYLRKHIQDESFENMDALRDRVINLRNRTYVNEKFDLGMNVFKFDDGFKIEITNEELYFVINVLFFEIDLMNQNTEVEIKKEKNIWAFNSDLAEYLPNGEIKRLQTMINHFNEEGLKIFEKTHETLDIIPALREKCSYTKEEYETLFIYKFDNGTEIELTEYDIETIATVIADKF